MILTAESIELSKAIDLSSKYDIGNEATAKESEQGEKIC